MAGRLGRAGPPCPVSATSTGGQAMCTSRAPQATCLNYGPPKVACNISSDLSSLPPRCLLTSELLCRAAMKEGQNLELSALAVAGADCLAFCVRRGLGWWWRRGWQWQPPWGPAAPRGHMRGVRMHSRFAHKTLNSGRASHARQFTQSSTAPVHTVCTA